MLNQQFERANATIEYAILIGAISILAMGGIGALGVSAVNQYNAAGVSTTVTPVSEQVITETAPESSPLPTPIPTPPLEPTPPPERPIEDIPDDENNTDERDRQSDYFFDNFDDGDTEGWLALDGDSWHLENNRYCTDPKDGEHRNFVGDTTWTDYNVSAQVELKQGKGYGLYFRAANTSTDNVNAYVFQYDPGFGHGAFLFRQVENGKERSPFARDWAPKDYNWYNQTRTISIQVKGDTFTAFIDGQQVLQGTHPDYTHGQIGLRTWSSSAACFDDITVTPLK